MVSYVIELLSPNSHFLPLAIGEGTVRGMWHIDSCATITTISFQSFFPEGDPSPLSRVPSPPPSRICADSMDVPSKVWPFVTTGFFH